MPIRTTAGESSTPLAYTCQYVHVANLTRRTQVLLDERRYQRLRARAAAERTSVGALVREAVDRALESDRDADVASAEAFLAAEPLPVGEPEELRDELESALTRAHP